MTKQEMRNKTRWILDELGVQNIPNMEVDLGTYSLDSALAEGINKYAEQTESYRVKYWLTTAVPFTGVGTGSNTVTPTHLTFTPVASGTILVGQVVTITGDSNIYSVATQISVTAAAPATVVLAQPLQTSPTGAAVSIAVGDYLLSSFTNPVDPTASSGGSVTAARMFDVQNVRYAGRDLDLDWEHKEHKWEDEPGWPRRYYQLDWQTIRIIKPAVTANTLEVEGYVTPDLTAFLADTAGSYTWTLAHPLDQPTPCYWAAIQLLTKSESKENAARITKCEQWWASKIAEAHQRIKKVNARVVRGGAQNRQFGRLRLGQITPLGTYYDL